MCRRASLCLCLFLQCLEGVVATPCWQGATFSEAVVSPALRSSSILRVPNVDTLKQCVGACCDLPGCDLAWLFEQRCYIISCQKRADCQPRKRHGAESYLAFLQRGQPQTLVLQSLVRGEPYPSRWRLPGRPSGNEEALKNLALIHQGSRKMGEPGIMALEYLDGELSPEDDGGGGETEVRGRAGEEGLFPDWPTELEEREGFNQSEGDNGLGGEAAEDGMAKYGVSTVAPTNQGAPSSDQSPTNAATIAENRSSELQNETKVDSSGLMASTQNSSQNSQISIPLPTEATLRIPITTPLPKAKLLLVSLGDPVEVTFPMDALEIEASVSLEPQTGSFYKYNWSIVQSTDGHKGVIEGEHSKAIRLSRLPVGWYVVMVAVSGGGLEGEGAVNITVKEAARPKLSLPPTATVVPTTQTVSLPASGTLIDGSESKGDGGIVSHHWDQLAGAPVDIRTSSDTQVLRLPKLSSGEYTFRLTVTDSEGLSDSTEAFVKVVQPEEDGQTRLRPDLPAAPSTNPDPVNPDLVNPDAMVPNAVNPDPVNPDLVVRNAVNHDPMNPDPVVPNAVNSDPMVPDLVNLVPMVPDPVSQDPVNPDPMVPDSVNPDAVNPDPMVPDPVSHDPVNPDPAVPDPVNPDPVNPDPALSWPLRQGEASTASSASPLSGSTPLTAEGAPLPASEVEKGSNQPPTAVVGPARQLTLPVTSVTLDGSRSTDDHDVVRHHWETVSGPPGSKIEGVDKAVATVTGLRAGRYTFRLTVSDQQGATDSASLTVRVQGASNLPPVAHASGSHTLTMPNNSLVLRGSVTDGNPAEVRFLWVRDSQSPAAGDVLYGSESQASLYLANLVEGTYLFQLRVTDAQGRTSTATATVEVRPEPGGREEVEVEMMVALAQVSVAQRDTVLRQLAALLHILDSDIHLRGLSGHSDLSTVLRFSVQGPEGPVPGSKLAGILQSQLLREKTDYLLFRVLRVDTVLCVLRCSGRGRCDPVTKECVCDPFWTENLLRRFLGDGQSNCEWRVLYVIISCFLAVVFVMSFAWAFICCCKRKRRTKVRKKTKYTILDNMDEQERMELRPKYNIKHRSTEHNSSLMMSESELDSDQDTIFSRDRPVRSRNRAQAARNGNAFG